ncbi:XRE family transcriptional regulator [Alteraurantiacibacter buctensis]|nr:LexA family transcriptional regulator [Alteraurantiacibacter buctensis]
MTEPMTLGDRISALLQLRGKSQAALARAIGVSPQAVSKMVLGGTTETTKVNKIAQFLETTPEYLMGETDDSSPTSSLSDKQVPFRHAEPHPSSDVVEIDYVEIGFGMGGGFIEESGEVEKRSFSRAWLREFTDAPPELLAWAKGDGDSMEPTIRDGEVVLIDRRFTQPGPNDQIWAITVGDFGMIKRLRARPDGAVEIHSDNPLVQMQTAVDGELHVIGRVRAVIRRV